jgi:ribose transport system permease protein
MTLTERAPEAERTPTSGTPGRRRPTLGTTGIIYLALVAIFILGAVLVAREGHNLLSNGNLVGMLTRSSVLGFVAIGQTFVLLCRSLDLSVGYVAALASLIGATTMDGRSDRILLGIAAALGAAALVGLANGLIITKAKVNPFITTLGVGLIIKGYLDTKYKGPSGSIPEAFRDFGYSRIGFVPISTAVMLGVAVIGIVVLRRTRTGYRMFAVGGNDEVARLSGIRTDRTVIVAHVLCSVAAGLAGLLLAARFSTGVAAQIYSAGYDLDSIAAVVLGGTLLMGGRGGIAGTIAGVLILAVLDTVFNLLQIDPFFRDVLRGVVIIVAVAIYARRQLDRRGKRPHFGTRAPGTTAPTTATEAPA